MSLELAAKINSDLEKLRNQPELFSELHLDLAMVGYMEGALKTFIAGVYQGLCPAVGVAVEARSAQGQLRAIFHCTLPSFFAGFENAELEWASFCGKATTPKPSSFLLNKADEDVIRYDVVPNQEIVAYLTSFGPMGQAWNLVLMRKDTQFGGPNHEWAKQLARQQYDRLHFLKGSLPAGINSDVMMWDSVAVSHFEPNQEPVRDLYKNIAMPISCPDQRLDWIVEAY